MQRRAAAVYFAIFVLLGAGAYAFMQVGMSQPTIELDGPTYSEGDEFTVDGVTVTVANITAGMEGGAHGQPEELVRKGNVTWANQTGDGRDFAEFQDGDNVTIAGVEHLAHFPSNDSVQLLPADEYWDSYQSQISAQEYFEERRNGFWGVVFLSFFAGIVLLAAAYLPTKG